MPGLKESALIPAPTGRRSFLPNSMPHIATHSAYMCEQMKRNVEASGIRMKEAPVESLGTLGVVER